MAIVWGAWSSNNRLRCGIEMSMSPGTVGPSTTQVTITTKIYLQSRYASNEYGTSTTWWISGDVSNSGNTDWNVGDMGTVQMGTDTQTFATSTSSTNNIGANGRIHSYYAYPGTDAYASTSITIPKRPSAVPAAPSNVYADRDSDSQATVHWTNHATSSAPYTSLTVNYQVQEGDQWSDWLYAAQPGGTSTSYIKSGLSANRKYAFRVRANNTAGSSSYTETTQDIYMTPAAPSNVESSVDPGGGSITTTWDNNAYASSTIYFTVSRSVNGGAWVEQVTDLDQWTTTWNDPSPGAGSNKYRVNTSTSEGPLTSGWAEGNTVSTIVAPLAPTNLSPSGQSLDLSHDQTLSWQHNHGGDSASQSHYTIETSDDGGSTWDPFVTDVSGTESHHHITGGTLSNGIAYQWRVKTEGIVSGGYGPFSAAATLTGSAIPTATLDPDFPPTDLHTTPIIVAWVYNQDQSSPQAEWVAELYQGTTLLETKSGTGTTATTSFSYPPATATTYTVRVRVRSGAGLWSDWATTDTNFELLPPAAAYLVPDFQQCTGVMVLELWAEEPTEGVNVAVESVTVERRVAGGDWVTIATGIEVPTTLLDMLPLTNGLNEYRVTSVSSSPSYVVNPVVVAYGTDGAHIPGGTDGLWVLLNYGDDFSNVLRFHGEPRLGVTAGRARATVPLLGREKPVPLFGTNTITSITAAGALYFDAKCTDSNECRYDSPPWDWVAMAHEATTVCYRDFTGRRFFGMLEDISTTDGRYPGFASLSLSVKETDYTEASRFGGFTQWIGGSSEEGGGGGDLTVTDHGDGTATLEGSAVTDHGDGTFTADSGGVTDHGDGTYTAAS